MEWLLSRLRLQGLIVLEEAWYAGIDTYIETQELLNDYSAFIETYSEEGKKKTEEPSKKPPSCSPAESFQGFTNRTVCPLPRLSNDRVSCSGHSTLKSLTEETFRAAIKTIQMGPNSLLPCNTTRSFRARNFESACRDQSFTGHSRPGIQQAEWSSILHGACTRW